MHRSIKWGIIGTGNIAHKFADTFNNLPDTELLAIGSRSQSTADKFGDKFSISRRYGSYEALAKDPDLDVIYIGTPHIFHKDNCLLCLENGKAVLCEKAFTINASEARQIIDFARSKRLFVMEAMWNRFQPALEKLRELVYQKVVGEIRMIRAELAFRRPLDPKHRLFAPDLGGGALLDLGVYPISLVSMILGEPEKIQALGYIGESGSDENISAIFRYQNGCLVNIFASLQTAIPGGAIITGSKGRIILNHPIYRPDKITVAIDNQQERIFHFPAEGNGMQYEILSVTDCLQTGQLESNIMPLDETLLIMKTMDKIRKKIGLKYPTE